MEYAEGGPSYTSADFRRICVCGARFGSHGADKPHKLVPTCNGFRDKVLPPVDPAVVKASAEQLLQSITEVENL